MTLSLPSTFSFQSSNIKDPAPTLAELMINCQAPHFEKGMELVDGQWVYEYNGDPFSPRVWTSAGENAGLYYVDEILLKGCKLIKVTGKSGTGITTHQKPKEPEEYGAWDTSLDPYDWHHRWIRVINTTSCGWLEKLWTIAKYNRQYSMYYDGNANKYKWMMRDLAYEVGCGRVNYKTQDMIGSGRYNQGKDIKATTITWGLQKKEPTTLIQSYIERGKYIYLRTGKDFPLQYHTWTTGSAFRYSYMTLHGPADIDGFRQKRMHNAYNPFDGKNYTKTEIDTTHLNGKATWTLINNEDMDSIAFGRVLCDFIDISILNTSGDILFQLTNYEIDNKVDPATDVEFPTTQLLYTEEMIPNGSVINLTLKGDWVEVGEMIPGAKLDGGMTKVQFKNKFKDFSPKEQDQWGNWYYKDGVRVYVHTGTVNFPIVSYDRLERMMMLIGGQKILINSSDSTKNEYADGRHVFNATMIIGRFTSLELSTSEEKKRIGDIGKYTFAIEELV